MFTHCHQVWCWRWIVSIGLCCCRKWIKNTLGGGSYSVFIIIYSSVHNNRTITFISDWMKGLPMALANAWPSLYHHCFCMWQIIANFQEEFKVPQLHRLLYEIDCASDPLVYKAKRKEINKISEPAHNWIKNSLHNQDHQWTLSKRWRKMVCDHDYELLRKLQRCIERSSSITNTSTYCKDIFSDGYFLSCPR